MPSYRRWSGPVALLALGVALTGCGSGSSQSEPTAWVGAFCGGIGNVLQSANALTAQAPNPQAEKENLLRFATDAQKAMSDTANKLTELGPPKIPNGQNVHDTAVNFFTSTAKSVEGQRAELDKLDASAPNFHQKLSQIAQPDLQATGRQVATLVSNHDLAPAFKSAPECKRLGADAQAR